MKLRGSQEFPKPPTATFRYTPGQSGTEASKECLTNTQDRQSRMLGVDNMQAHLINQAQFAAERLSMLKVRGIDERSYDNIDGLDAREGLLSSQFVREVEDLNLDQNLDLSFFK